MKMIVGLSVIRWFLVFVWLSAFGLSPTAFAGRMDSLPASADNSITQPADIEVFVQEGCPHCANALAFLQALKREQPTLSIATHDVVHEPSALERLRLIARNQGINAVRVPAFQVGGQLISGYSEEAGTDQLLRSLLAKVRIPEKQDDSGSCTIEAPLSCEAAQDIDFFGYRLSLDQLGLPLFTLAIGLLDGFNPCSIWVLLLMVSLLASMKDRMRMFMIAGTFVAVEGLVYFIFMAAWLNLFLLIGLSRVSEIAIAVIALLVGAINLKDFRFYRQGVSLTIPDAAKPDIYARMRKILQAQNLTGALIGAVVLAVLVQIVEFMCTSGFPALYTRILTLKQPDSLGYYGYLLLYNLAYMFDDVIVLAIGIVTLSQRRLQEREGRLLKLISGLAMIGVGVYLLLKPVGEVIR
ncbi:MAG: NrdH-redoxin [Methylobacter tundripaludum]|nr:NrdH-redoxin [Methylobacter tundripaludum]